MRYLLSLIFVTLTTFICAQSQRGVVRSIGTPTHHGQPLSGAMVKIKGNNQQFLSGTNGTIELPLHNSHVGDKYQLQNVTKKGYELADKNFMNQTFVYSDRALLEIVMLSSEDMLREKQTIETRVLKIAEKNYKKKIDALKQDKEQGRITVEDYRARYQTLQEQFDTYDEIISEMAEHYARTDYDRLDSLDILINVHITNGELGKADLLIAQKGNLDERIAAYQRHAATNAAAKEMLDKLRDELHEQRLVYEKERNDISNDLYNKHSIAISRFNFDMALEMLKIRSDLDTTNVKAVWEYADLCYKQHKFADCKKYLMICLRACNRNGELQTTATIQNSLGNLYSDLHDYANSESYYKLALKNYELLFNQDMDAYRTNIAGTQNNLGNLYADLHDYVNSEKYYKLALKNYELLSMQNPNVYRTNLASIYNNCGSFYNKCHDYTSSEKYCKLALENYEILFNQDPDAYRASLAMTQNNLGNLYFDSHDFTSSKKYFMLALDNYELLFKQNPDAYRASLAMTQSNLGNIYIDSHDFTNSEKYLKSALDNYELLFKQDPSAYRSDLAVVQNVIGALYSELHDYANSEKCLKLALENYELLFKQNQNAYRSYLASTYWNMMILYDTIDYMDHYDSVLENVLILYNQLYLDQPAIYKNEIIALRNRIVRRMLLKGNTAKAIDFAKETYSMDESNTNSKYFLAQCYNMKAYDYANENELTKAMDTIDTAIALVPDVVDFYDSKGEILLMQGKNEEALEMWKKVLDLNPEFLKDYPDGTNLSNGLKKLGMIE